MKPVMAIIGVGIIILMMGGIMLGLKNFRTADFSEPHIIATEPGETSVNIVLAQELFDDNTVNVTLTSTNTDDAPVPFTYASATRQLTVNGLNASDTRTLTILYKVSQLDDTTDLGARFLPLFLILGGIAVIVGASISAFKGH